MRWLSLQRVGRSIGWLPPLTRAEQVRKLFAPTAETMPLAVGTETRYGRVEAVVVVSAERFYILRDGRGAVVRVPAELVEPADLRRV